MGNRIHIRPAAGPRRERADDRGFRDAVWRRGPAPGRLDTSRTDVARYQSADGRRAGVFDCFRVDRWLLGVRLRAEAFAGRVRLALRVRESDYRGGTWYVRP